MTNIESVTNRIYPVPGFRPGYTGYYEKALILQCLRCGEVHATIVIKNQIHLFVNGKIVDQCINCAWQRKSVKLW